MNEQEVKAEHLTGEYRRSIASKAGANGTKELTLVTTVHAKGIPAVHFEIKASNLSKPVTTPFPALAADIYNRIDI